MERARTFLIEPYVDGGGVLGQRLEVNEKAANSIMKRTALRRDVHIVKGYGREKTTLLGVKN